MNYFNDVYLKRLNRFGNTIQKRVHGQMEYDFEIKLQKSVNRIDYYLEDGSAARPGIVEEKKIGSDMVVNYLMTRLTDELPTGTIVEIAKPHTTEKQKWLIFIKEEYETIGYNRYQTILLDGIAEWIDYSGELHKSPAHYIRLMDKAIKEQFRISFDSAAVIPFRKIMLVMKEEPGMSRSVKINIDDTTWKVVDVDKQSVKGVFYITLQEDYLDRNNIANQDLLEGWSIISERGETISVKENESTEIQFYASFDGVLSDHKINVTCSDAAVVLNRVDNQKFTISAPYGNYVLEAALDGIPDITMQFELVSTPQSQQWLAIVGPDQIKVLQVLKYTLATNIPSYSVQITSQNGNFSIVEVQDQDVYIKGEKIGQDNIVIQYGAKTYYTPIEVLSAWM